MNQKKEANSESWEKSTLQNSERSLGQVARRGCSERRVGVGDQSGPLEELKASHN